MAQWGYTIPINVALAALIVTFFYGPGLGGWSVVERLSDLCAPPTLLRAMYGDADTVYFNASVWTGNKEKPWVEAFAVQGAKLVKVGTFDGVRKLSRPRTAEVDLQGRFVTPGFIDSHVHFIHGGLQLTRLDLVGVKDRASFQAAVSKAAQATRDGEWILGGGWDHETWGGELPVMDWIDEVAPQHLVWLTRLDGHMGLANRLTLTEAAIDESTPDPEGGSLARDENGRPTGLLRDAAMYLLSPFIPAPTTEDKRRALRTACELANRNGITGVHDFGNFGPGDTPDEVWADIDDVYLPAAAAGNMSVRVYAFTPLETHQKLARRIKAGSRRPSPWLHIGGVKAFADGSLGSSTALFHEAFADDPENRGLTVAPEDWLRQSVVAADAARLQVAVHAIGDAANDRVLAAYRVARATNGLRNARHRIEHAQHLAPGAPDLFRKYQVIASMQPHHLIDDMTYMEKRLGKARASNSSYHFRTLLDKGVHLALGSDWTVAPLDALDGMHAATHRRPRGSKSGAPPWLPQQSISAEEALIGYTQGAAYASMWEDEIGSLGAGKIADFVVLDRSPLIASDELPKVLQTFVGGKRVYFAEDV